MSSTTRRHRLGAPASRAPSSSCLPAGLGLALLLVSATGVAERFPFVIPGDDASRSFTDLSVLNGRPAGADGFVRVRDGHFATDAGRLRFWGVNVCFEANFPSHAEAEKVAAHLAKLGVNAVRFHHHDTAPSPRGVLGRAVNGRRKLDPERLDRQDYFLDQLHRHGIYANLNLHVGRTFTEAEGFVSQGLPREVRYDKYLLYFDPRMRERFKEFCRDYLGHENPYRRRRRADDPGIAMIEITNENPFTTKGAEIAAGLPEPYRGEFQRQWNRWLAVRYPDTAALRAAWSSGNEPLGRVLADGAAWGRSAGRWRVHQRPDHPVRLRFGQPGPDPETPALRVEIVSAAPAVHEQELQFPDLQLEPGRACTLSFWVKAAAERTLHADVSNQGPPSWNSVGYGETLKLTTEWQRVHRVFRVEGPLPGRARICFKFGGDATDFWLAGLSLREGGDWIVLPPGQSLAAGNVGIPVAGWADAARRDVRRFMAETEEAFVRDLVEFLKRDVGVRVPITASQITYHAPGVVARTCDYTDIHAYWQHPRFPRRPWDPVDWYIPNTPMEAAPGTDALLGRTPWRLLDRPFTISEWNIPDPNDYAASVAPFAAMVAALQDWDGVFFFQYQSGADHWFTDRVQRFFAFNGNPVKLALLTACANLYRRGDLPPLAGVAAGTLGERLPPTLALSRRIGVAPEKDRPDAVPAPSGRRLSSPEGTVVWDATEPERAFVQVITPRTVAVWGRIGGRRFTLGKVRFTVGKVARDYAVVVLTSLDELPLGRSRRMLLTAVGSAENPGMAWNADRTSVGNRWGHGPAEVNGIPLEVELAGPAVEVRALDGRGGPQGAPVVVAEQGSGRFRVGPAQRTLWYQITR